MLWICATARLAVWLDLSSIIIGGYLRISIPDYRFDIYNNRCIKDNDGKIVFDPDGGGSFVDGKVCDGGHLWFPTYESTLELVKKTNFTKYEFYHYYDTDGTPVTKKIDYSKGFVQRTPDNDERDKSPFRPMSIVVDLMKYLPYLATILNLRIGIEEMERAGGIGGAENHATALDALYLTGFEIDNHQNLAANDFFGLVMLCNARYNRALIDAGIDSEFQELVGLGNLLCSKDCGGADVALIEVVESNDLLLIHRLEILFLVLNLGTVELIDLSLNHLVCDGFKEHRRRDG